MTDVEIRRNVEAELRWEPALNSAATIGVRVKDGIVTLTGTVKTNLERVIAERAAARSGGVRAVVNELEVPADADGVHPDETIARAAADALQWKLGIPLDQVKFTVDDGWITLKGVVDRPETRAAAENAVNQLDGVEGVINLVEVESAAAADVLKQSIEQALQRMAETEAASIGVEVIGNKVVLTGTVQSLAEKREAERAAWQAPGVTQVVNRIVVSAAA